MRMLIRFGKNQRLRFISHLDLQRFLHMAMNRCGLPIMYSQGFNPHPVMAFGSALALGWTSEYEILDVKLSAPMGRKRCEEAMRAALPVDMPVYEVKLVDDKAPSAMARVVASDYEIILDGEDVSKVIGAIPLFMGKDVVMAKKKSKSGEKEINIRPMALSVCSEENKISARLMLTEKETLKADLLVNALMQLSGAEDVTMRIHRKCLLGRNGNGELCPFMEI